jgi:hypothetical protein
VDDIAAASTQSAVLEQPPASPSDWRSFVTDELKEDPAVRSFTEKATEKDIPSLVKGYAHLSKRMGSAINLPGKDAKPEELTALKAKLIEAGVMPKPIADPKDYAITKPDNLPAGVNWSDELSTKLATTLHKYQVPKEAVADLLALHMESLGGTVGSFAGDHATVMMELKAEHGEKFDERKELATRLIGEIFKTDEEAALANQLGLGENARFVSLLMRLAPLAMQDSSFMESLSVKGGEITSEAARDEYAKVMSDPKHPHYEGFKKGTKEAMAYVDNLYKQSYGNAPVTL